MSIQFDDTGTIITLHTCSTTYQMAVDEHKILRHLYYGPRAAGDAYYLHVPADRGYAMQMADAADDRTYSLDAIPQEYPVSGAGDMRSPAFIMENPDGSAVCDLRFLCVESRSGKYTLPGMPHTFSDENDAAETLAVTLKDAVSGVEVQLLYGVLPEVDVITRNVIVKNGGDSPVVLKKVLSANLDFVYGRYDLITFYGRHAMERNYQRQEIRHGAYSIGSRRGSSSHQYNPMMILTEKDASETAGSAYAMEFVWSGAFTALAEKDQYDGTRWQMGLMDENFSYPLAPGESFTAPEVILSFSSRGIGQLSINLHDCIRRHLIRAPWKNRVRPLLLNSWEGCYFDFDGERICVLAEQAKSLGLDMIVMDDGWFGKRDDDRSGLGDWFVNEKKLGGTLSELIRVVHGMGLLFGIWIEPEMVSEDSDLMRRHPDFALAAPGRMPVQGRNQLVLDFSRKDVVDCVFEQLCATFDKAVPDYIKWDFNRSLCEAYSQNAADQGRVFYDFMLGTYDLLERLRQRYPDILIEGCAGGGGRFDAGMLYYTPQIWGSDNTDAVDRIRIQYGTSFGYPISSIGAHVSVSPNEQNGRVTPLATRAAVAMAGTFGYEFDPEHMPEEEKEEIRKQVAAYRKYAPLLMDGHYLRLTNPYEDHVGAWEVAARDGNCALVTAVTLEIHGNRPQNYIRLRGLIPGAFYRDEGSGRVWSADMLMHAGLPVPVEMCEYASHVWYLVRQEV